MLVRLLYSIFMQTGPNPNYNIFPLNLLTGLEILSGLYKIIEHWL